MLLYAGPMQSWSLMMEKTLQRLWFLIPRCLTHQNGSSDTSSGGGLVSTINKPFIYRFQILITTLYNTPIFNQKQIKGVGGPKLPRCLKELAGNQYVFPQTCTFNFTFNHRTFTGSSITEDILLDPLTVVVSSYSWKGSRGDVHTEQAPNLLARLVVLPARQRKLMTRIYQAWLR